MSEDRNAPPSTAELYLRATRTSHLELKERRGDVDRIIAAGLGGNSLGAQLWRMVDEYMSLDKTIKVAMPSNGMQTHRLLILMDMTTLRDVLPTISSVAHVIAEKRLFVADDYDGTVRKIVGRVIDVFLDDRCHHCNGVGTIGEFGKPQNHCRPCNGSGKRRGWVGRSAAEQDLAAAILAYMDHALAEAERDMKRNAKAVVEAKERIARDAKML